MKRFFIRMLGSAMSLTLLCACVSDTRFITDYDDPLPGPGACLNFDPSQRLVSHETGGADEVRIPRRSGRVYAAQPSDALWRSGDTIAILHVESAQRTGPLRPESAHGMMRQARPATLPNPDLTLRRRSLNNVCKNIRKMDKVLMAHWLTRDLSRMAPADTRAPRMRPQLPQASNHTSGRILV